MRPIRIFISSVQQEFAKERKALAEYMRTDALLGRFFEVSLFEEMPAKSQAATRVYFVRFFGEKMHQVPSKMH